MFLYVSTCKPISTFDLAISIVTRTAEMTERAQKAKSIWLDFDFSSRSSISLIDFLGVLEFDMLHVPQPD